MKILDWYIICKFLGTYLFAIVLILAITVMFDVNEKLDAFLKAPLKATESKKARSALDRAFFTACGAGGEDRICRKRANARRAARNAQKKRRKSCRFSDNFVEEGTKNA